MACNRKSYLVSPFYKINNEEITFSTIAELTLLVASAYRLRMHECVSSEVCPLDGVTLSLQDPNNTMLHEMKLLTGL